MQQTESIDRHVTFWQEEILPALEEVRAQRPNDSNVDLLDMVIRNREQTGIQDFQIQYGLDARLRINPKDNRESALKKMTAFLMMLEAQGADENEGEYTHEDQAFWREIVLPALATSHRAYPNDPHLKLLTVTVENRLLLATKNMDITVAGIRLRIGSNDSKRTAQAKLGAFLEDLSRKVKSDPAVQAAVEVRTADVTETLKATLKDNWAELEKDVADGKVRKHRYKKADQLFWRETVIPAIAKLAPTLNDNRDFVRLAGAIRSGTFLTSGPWDIHIYGASLSVEITETQDEKQKKLGAFLEALMKDVEYTPEDQTFWRQTVIPRLRELSAEYGDDEGFQVLSMAVEMRTFLKMRCLVIQIDGVSLEVFPDDSKEIAQKKLERFLETLRSRAGDTGMHKEMQRRIRELEQALEQRDQMIESLSEKATASSGRTVKQLEKEVERLQREASTARKRADTGDVKVQEIKDELARVRNELRYKEDELRSLRQARSSVSYSYTSRGE